MKGFPYHTALKGYLDGVAQLSRPVFLMLPKKVNGMAFVLDVVGLKGLPNQFDGCDVLYAEIPWMTGFRKFEMRAGIKETRKYDDLLASIRSIIRNLKVPMVLILGGYALRRLGQPSKTGNAVLNGNRVLSAAFGDPEVTIDGDCTAILARLCKRWSCIGDPFCGYGRTAIYAAFAGKRFVVSDYNVSCIDFIRENIL